MGAGTVGAVTMALALPLGFGLACVPGWLLAVWLASPQRRQRLSIRHLRSLGFNLPSGSKRSEMEGLGGPEEEAIEEGGCLESGFAEEF